MKNLSFIIVIIVFFACSQSVIKNEQINNDVKKIEINYIDSINETNKYTVEVFSVAFTNINASSLKLICELKSLKKLSLFECNIDSIKEDIQELTNLEYLVLSGNPLAYISPKINSLEKLTKLSLDTMLNNRLPDNFIQLKNIRVLSMSFNRFEKFPVEIFQLESLEELTLKGCNLYFMPEGWKNLKKLKRLDLEDNHLNKFPEDLLLENLEEINIAGNPFSNEYIDSLNNIYSIKIRR